MKLPLKLLFLTSLISFCLLARADLNDDFAKYISRDSVDGVKELLDEGYDPNTILPNGRSLLSAAILDNAFKSARFLINQKNIKIDIRSQADETALMIASLRGNLDLVKLLVYRGADVNKTGWTPLHYAASGGHTQVMRFLLDKNAYIDAASPSGNTPLMMAVLYGSEDSVEYLLGQGADPTILNGAKRSAIDLAKGAERVTLAEILEVRAEEWIKEAAKEKELADKADLALQKQLAEERSKIKKMAEEKQLALIKQQKLELEKQEEQLRQETLQQQQSELALREGLDLHKFKQNTIAENVSTLKSNSLDIKVSNEFSKINVGLGSNNLSPDSSTTPQLIQLERKVLSVAKSNFTNESGFKVATIQVNQESEIPVIDEKIIEEDFDVVIDPITLRLIKIKKKPN